MSYNPNRFYWLQFSNQTSTDGYLDKSLEARALRDSDPHDARTRRLIEQYDQIYQLEESNVVVPLIEQWSWLERMGDNEQKQSLLEPLIQQVQREPGQHRGELIFLLLVLEPIRRAVASKLIAGVGLSSRSSEGVERHRREEARWLREMEREELLDHTRFAALEMIHGYSFNVLPGRFFGWFRETLAWRIIDTCKKEYLGPNSDLPRAQVEALQNMLHGFESLGAPDLRDKAGLRAWRRKLGGVRPLFSLVDRYREAPQVRKVCKEALGRLGLRQRQTLEQYFYDGLSLAEIAERRRVTLSTVGNTKAQAEARLRSDDMFYCALDALGRVRIQARRRDIERRYPDGYLPDGRRIVFIDTESRASRTS